MGEKEGVICVRRGRRCLKDDHLQTSALIISSLFSFSLFLTTQVLSAEGGKTLEDAL